MSKSTIYDLQIVMPVTFEGKYGQRLLDFKKTGLLNIKDKKVLVTLLIGPERAPFWKGDWPDGVDVEAIESPHKQETPKTYSYFGTLKAEDIRARWIAKIDDDTINDVSNWVDKLDEEYDHTREYYIVTEFRPEQHAHEDNILREMGFNRWFTTKKCVIWHELEGCVVSEAALSRIVSNETATKFMQKRATIPEGYNDYALACAARICKIYPSDAYFMSKLPQIGDLMLFGGHLCHIHEISHDRNFHCFDLIQRMMNEDIGSETDIHNEVVGKEFVYTNGHAMLIVKLEPNGVISGQRSDARIWHVKPNGFLEFLRSDGSLVEVFDNYENTNFMEGYHDKNSRLPGKPQLRKLA